MSKELDELLGGGIALGRVTEICMFTTSTILFLNINNVSNPLSFFLHSHFFF